MSKKPNLKIGGIQKTTLLDYPGKVASTIFVAGCNFRCPFCQNSEFFANNSTLQLYDPDDIIRFLRKRKGVLDGVCVTGGEPTIYRDALLDFLKELKDIGLSVKLDTNGANPDILKKAVSCRLIDFTAIDIKTSPKAYEKAAGVGNKIVEKVKETVDFLKTDIIPYEFRTTAVKGIHTEKDFLEIGEWISGCDNYFIQNYRSSDTVYKPEGLQSFSYEELKHFADIVKPYVRNVSIRGIDESEN